MKRVLVVLVALGFIAACSAATLQRTPEPPRIRCLAMGHVPDSAWWVYVCTFTGDTLAPPELPDGPTIVAGGA